MPIFQTVIYGILTPAVISGVIMLAGWWNFGGERLRLTARPSTALAYGIALVVAHLFLIGWPSLPVEEEGVLTLGVLAAAVFSAAASLLRLPAAVNVVWGVLVLSLAGYLAVGYGSGLEPLLWTFAVLASGSILWLLLGQRAAGDKGWELPFLLLLALSGMVMVFALGTSIKFMQLGAALTAVTGAAWVVSLIRPAFSMSPGGIAALSVGLSILLVGGNRIAGVDLPATLLLGVGLLVPCIRRLLPLERLPRATAVAVQALLIIILAGTAVLLTYLGSSLAEPAGEDYAPY
jgi:hypothetical protein